MLDFLLAPGLPPFHFVVLLQLRWHPEIAQHSDTCQWLLQDCGVAYPAYANVTQSMMTDHAAYVQVLHSATDSSDHVDTTNCSICYKYCFSFQNDACRLCLHWETANRILNHHHRDCERKFLRSFYWDLDICFLWELGKDALISLAAGNGHCLFTRNWDLHCFHCHLVYPPPVTMNTTDYPMYSYNGT